MTYQENRIVAFLVSNLLGIGLYSFYVFQRGGGNAAELSNYWGSRTLIVIAVIAISTFIISAAANILQAIANRDTDPILADERDQLLERKADHIAFSLFGIGFIIAMIMFAAGISPLWMFHSIVYAFFGAITIGSILRLYFYRREL